MAYTPLPATDGVTRYDAARDQYIQAGITAAAAGDDARIVGLRAATARRVLAAQRRLADVGAIHPSPPTVTVGTAGAGTTISGGVWIHPKRSSSTVIDTVNDPHFEWVGMRPGQMNVSSSDMMRPLFLTGGSSQSTRDRVRVRFQHSGQVLELYYRALTTALSYRIWIDGMPTAQALTTATVVVASRYMLKLDFGADGSRVVEVEVNDPEFGGVYIEPTGTITRTRLGRPAMLAFGDSITGAANGVSSLDAWPRYASQILGVDWINSGIGGTGFYAGSGTGGDFRQRVTPDIVSVNPDAVVVFGSYNDSASSTQQQIQDEATYVFGQIMSGLPNALVIAVGCWTVGHSVNAAFLAADNGVKAAAAAVGIPFVSLLDPAQVASTTSAWATSTVYAAGDQIVANGWVQKCLLAHTSSASFDQTKFRSTTFVTGTGKSTALAGNGNADYIISSDGTHPTAVGHRALGYHLAQEVTRAARTVAGV